MSVVCARDHDGFFVFLTLLGFEQYRFRPTGKALWQDAMAAYEHLPIFKKAMDLCVFMEKAVAHFPRYHKYTLGSELRGMCHTSLGMIVQANSSRDRKPILLDLRIVLEQIKIHLMVAREVNAFQARNAFAQSVNLVVDISRQNEGWIKSVTKSDARLSRGSEA